jgi:hypothetical protein
MLVIEPPAVALPAATSEVVEGQTTSPAVRRAAWVYGALVAASAGHFLLGIPIQLTDSFGNILKLDASWPELLYAEFTQRAYLRPFLWAQLKGVYDLSDGSYFAWFRGVHAAQVAALVALYIHLVRPRTWRDAAALSIGIAALLGIHTFTGTIVEAFPINTFLTILICCFAAAALSLARYRWWNDVLAILLFVCAALTVESGLLVAVIVVGGALVGGRGVSRAGVALVVTALAGYFVLRFEWLEVGAPGLLERASGYGSRVLEPRELVERFGSNPLPFYAYNVIASVMSVLLSEPRSGVFPAAAAVIGGPDPAMVVNVMSSLLATSVIAWYAWVRRRQWIARRFDHGDRLVLLFVIVLGGNAALSYAYTKDVIMSPAGGFYALALFAAAQQLLAVSGRPSRIAWTAVLCAALGAGWSIRYVGAHMNLRQAALTVRNEWAYAEQWLEEQDPDLSQPRTQELLRTLKHDAMIAHPAPAALPLLAHPLLDVND